MALAHTAEESLSLNEKYEAICYGYFVKLTEKIIVGVFLIEKLLVHLLYFDYEENNMTQQYDLVLVRIATIFTMFYCYCNSYCIVKILSHQVGRPI